METDRSIYLSIAELSRRYSTPQRPAGNGQLTASELRCFSQHGEDGVIAEILTRIGTAVDFFVEFGIEGGREGNCVFLADVLGWNGLFIESDQNHYAELASKYETTEGVRTLNAMVTPDNADDLFDSAGVPREPDVLSIDVDGPDYWIWEALEKHRPRLVVIEYNAALPPGRQLVQPRSHADSWDRTDYFGASLDALCALADRKGYRLVHTDLAALNAFFVRADLGGDLLPRHDEVPRRHRPNYYLQGVHHPVATRRRAYTDLASGQSNYPPGAIVEPHPRASLKSLTPAYARELAERADFTWHQHFELAPGVFSPGVSDVAFLFEAAAVPARLDNATVLDIGTTNGGAAFECERRGASRVVAVDIADENWFGFAALKEALGSQAQHVQASIYELPEILREQFDVVLFWGVLYHLRHPLLALDNVRRLARGRVSIETSVSDYELTEQPDLSLARFYRADELAGDSSNWFSPNVAALTDWCGSCGLEPTRVRSWPEGAPSRAMVVASAADPEYLRLSYERPLSCSVPAHGAQFGT